MFSLNLKIWYLKVLNNTSANNINFFSKIFKIFKFGNLPYIYRSQEFLVNNSIAILILFHPTLIILFFMMYNNPDIILATKEVMIFTILLFSCIFGFLISSFSFFKILGSPQRYLEYCLPLYVFYSAFS